MRSALLQRVLALAGATLLAAIVALAVAEQVRTPAQASGVQPALGPGAGWHLVRAGVAPEYPPRGKRSACGWLLRPSTLGVVHPVLPCGAKVLLDFRGRRVLTEVVDRAPVAAAEDLALTPALAEELGLTGVRQVRWAFARAG
ncbi:MAG TPA: hypothetical protein VFA44_13120 [Gaiellaceae bacterium]|nr:hypothetical protein [Gaiellaceae bacterium]